MAAPTLIQERQTWQHFIGGYYTDTDRFIREAQRIGISRRAPGRAIRGMNFGDRLLLLRYMAKDHVAAFAEAAIIGMTLDHEIADAVGQQLKERGLATYQEGGGDIERECGSYSICGTWTVTATWAEIMDIALAEADAFGQPLFVMVNARLVAAYPEPVYLQPAPKFTRGFTRIANDTAFTPWDAKRPDGTVFAIRGYQKAPRRLPAPAPGGA